MASLYSRIRRRIEMTAKDLRTDMHFSPVLAASRMCANLCGRAGLGTIAAAASRKTDAFIRTHLEKTLAPILEQYAQDEEAGDYAPNAPIWICWWTGEETAPPLVKRCIRSIRENAGDHPVHLIDRDHYSDYLEIPEHILSKVDDGTMCIANFSDYLRFSLLAAYGGLWLDATIYCSGPIPEDYFRLPLFTCKGTLGDPGGYLSQYRWTSFCFGGHRGNVMLRYMQQAFDVYWQRCDRAIDYLLVDYLIDLAYRKLPPIRRLLDAVPESNLHRDDLQAAMNAALPASAFESVLHPDTVLYKLSWRETYAMETADAQESIFCLFLKH